MGKKIALGCLGVGAVVLIGGGLLLYFFVAKPVMGSMSSLQEINEINEQVENKTPYEEPQNGEMTEEQVEKFVTVQTRLQQRLETRMEEFREKYEEIETRLDGTDPSIRHVMGAWGDIVDLYSDAKQIQVDALNQEGLSLEEYRWVQQSFYQALGVELFSYDIDAIAEAAREGNFDINTDNFETRQDQLPEVPERNRELVVPYADSTDAWITFAWFGL